MTHSIKPFDSSEAAFQLRCCYNDFPDGTIHIVGVDTEPRLTADKTSFPSIMLFKGQYFISNDNGFFGAFLDDEFPDELYNFTAIQQFPEMLVFTAKTCFIPLAERIVKGEKIASFAAPTNKFRKAFSQKPIIEQFLIQGNVVHIDSFGNIITNISRKDFDRFGKEVPYVIYYLSKQYHIDEISQFYSDVSEGERVAIFNSNDLLEIAINRGANGGNGGAAKLFGVRIGDAVRIEFTPAGSHKDFNSLF